MKSWGCEVSFGAGKLQPYLKGEAACHEYCSQAMIITSYSRNIRHMVGRISLALVFLINNKQGNFVALYHWFKGSVTFVAVEV